MSLRTLTAALRGEIPGTSDAQLKVYVNEALGLIYDDQQWSFQLQTSNWFTPGLLGGSQGVSPGTITVNTYDTTITGDATASAAWLALTGRPFLTEYQIRIPYYSLYSIIAVDATDPNAVILTIDRPWGEPSQAGASYMAYQAYFPAPVQTIPTNDFKRFIAIRDTTNAIDMDYWSYRQSDLALADPQRTIFNLPCYVVPFQVDQRPNSATIGQMLYELWPNPLSRLPYTVNYMRRGPLLVRNSDEIPYPLTEELVKWRAIEVASLWKERQKGDDMARGSGADWKFSSQAAHAEFVQLKKQISQKDRDLVDLYFNRMKQTTGSNPFATINGQLNVGRW